MRSRPVFVLALLGAMAVAVVIGIALDLPPVVVALIASFAGTALYLRHVRDRRSGGATEREPAIEGEYPVRLPAQRVAPGRALQVTFLPSTRAVHAEGLLCVRPGEMAFVPSRDKDAAKAWSGSVTGVSLERTLAETTVRVRTTEGPAQFVVQGQPDQLDGVISPYVRIGPA